MTNTETIKSQRTITELSKNFNDSVELINNTIIKNNLVLLVNGNESLSPLSLVPHLNHLDTINPKRKIAQKMYNLSKKQSIKSINMFLHVANKIGIIEDNVRVLPSKKEQEIQRKRKVWKKLRDEAETALLDYKKEKGNFYK